jgi:hypothetical protein
MYDRRRTGSADPQDLEQKPKDGAPNWSVGSAAADSGISKNSVHQVLRTLQRHFAYMGSSDSGQERSIYERRFLNGQARFAPSL